MKQFFFIIMTSVILFSGCTVTDPVDYREDDGTGISDTSPEPDQILSNSTNGWEQSGVFYHVWMRAFRDGEYDDGIGDLKGVISKLNYLDDLGVTAIWLSPIFQCDYKGPNMHGYDSTNMYRINERFGTSADVKDLLVAAHALGMKVIYDYVPNHTSSKHSWFEGSKPAGWYVWQSSLPSGWYMPWGGGSSADVWKSGRNGYFYTAFLVDSLADLNYGYTTDGGTTYPVRDEMENVVDYWLARGFDGIRIDAVRYIWEDGGGMQADRDNTHLIMQHLRSQVVKNAKYDASRKMMVGEVWTGSDVIKTYFQNSASGSTQDELDTCFDFGLPYNIRDSINNRSNDAFNDYVNYVAGLGFPRKLSTFTVNHDNVVSRAMTLYNDRKKCINAAALNLLSYGVPYIYYGEEVGMTGASGDDINLRSNFPWGSVTSQNGNPQSILSWYKYLVHARTGNISLNEGGFSLKGTNEGDSSIIAFVKDWGTQYSLVVINLASSAKTVTVNGLPVGSGTSQNIIGSNQTSISGNAIQINAIPANGVRVILLQSGGGYNQTGIFAGDLN